MAAHSQGLTRLALALVVVLFGLVAPSQGAQARRIVSLVPALTEMLFAIGAGPQVVGVSSYDDFPEPVKSLPKVGALLDPDMERILSLRPTLVITYGSQTDVERQLERTKIRTFSYRHTGLAGLFRTMHDLGEAVGRTMDADRVAQDLQSRLNSIKTRVSTQRPVRTLLVFERDPRSLRGLFVSGGVGFLHDMLDIAGGSNIFADVKQRAVQATTETILARRPEVILEVRAAESALAPADQAAEIAAWRRLSSVPAVRTGRVFFLIDDRLVIPGPRVVEGTRLLAHTLHPDAM